jgi:hypothetical protein
MSDEPVSQHDPKLAEKVEAALKAMAADKRVKRTLTQLARLTGISRGTVYNHKWVVKRWRKFRAEENEPRAKVKALRSTTHDFDAKKSDAQILLWKRKCDNLADENENLKRRLESLRRELQRRSGADDGNVLPFPGKPDA